jgi:hypothetical protein
VAVGSLLLACRGGEEEEVSTLLRRGSGRLEIFEAAKMESSLAICRPCFPAVDERHGLTPAWRLLRRAFKQGTVAGGSDRLASAIYGRAATLFVNLRARRHFFGFTATSGVVYTPSGMFPGGVEDGRYWSSCVGGDQGPNCVPLYFPRVLCAYCQGVLAFSLSLRVLDVKLVVTALD